MGTIAGQVTRTTGEGPVLLVLPLASAGGVGGFEAWRPLKHEDRANYMVYELIFILVRRVLITLELVHTALLRTRTYTVRL